MGKNPTHRHDETEWLKLEKARKKNAGTDLSAKCCLIEIRADWDWFQHWMAAPAWNQGSGVCWLCKACRNRLYKLTVKDIVKPKKPAELDVKAAHCRHFMGFLPKLAKAKFGADVSAMTNEQKAVQALAQLIAQVYDHLEKMNQKSLQKLEKGPSNNIWLWRQPPNSMTVKMLKHGTASQSAICLAICVIEPVKAGTQKILGITEMRHLPSQWQPWVARELGQTKNPWQKPF